MPNLLPKTNVRLASSLILKVFTPTNDAPSLLLGVPITPGIILGGTTLFERRETRQIYRRYQLGEFAFQPRDLIPQKTEVSLRLRKVVLYKQDVLQSLGFSFSGSLIEQILPLILQEIRNVPEGIGAKIQIIEYHDCWVSTNPITYDSMNTDQLMLQDIEIQVGQVRPIITSDIGSITSTLFTAASLLSAPRTLLDKPVSLLTH